MATKQELLKVLSDQLKGLGMMVESDSSLPLHIDDYNVTLNSLKKQIEAAHKMPDDLMGSSKNPNAQQVPRPKQNKTAVPIVNRRAAIEHTRKLNESLDNS